MKTLTLKKTGYYVIGIADLTMWGGGNACVIMTPFKVGSITKKTLLKNINDAGFGVEHINGAICDIHTDYEGTHKFLKTVTVGKVSPHTLTFYEGGER